ncbi:ATP-dependent nuclease [Mesorhizobium australafricanum]|uniref:AAA family ATPase n=1 Tax=Mesorhizobium australafricanum TaxID=3072311 RepID=A0ABU4X485_9HYPH|nr:AAA family ATPase [Mesorhizobium sp. VK3E]MDX8443141.1 AAA family ATPase [Mesorhizobium sp. VK3E]
MKFIKEIEIAYFRSFYKETLYKCSDLNIIFGKNDVGKSNIIRALNLFFNNSTDDATDFNFDIDFSDKRRSESENSEGIRKFIYVKITFSTPSNYRKSLGNEFYVKRQWTVSRDDEYVEEFSSHIKANQRHIVTRFLNLIRFIHIPAIKDTATFRKLLGDIYDILSNSEDFLKTVEDFASRVQSSTSELFSSMPKEIAHRSKISAPSRMVELFETLDFETIGADGHTAKSLTLQRGDGIKARHIPEILNFICDRDSYQFHIWGFEEPENSLDFVSAEAEASRFLKLALAGHVQVFVTTHSPSFYNLNDDGVRKFYVTRDDDQQATIVQGRNLEKLDIVSAVGEGFYLPAVAKALEEYSIREADAAIFRAQAEAFQEQIKAFTQPVILTEGKTDEVILLEAWRKLRGGRPPFKIKCCDITDGTDGGSAGASRLALSLRAVPYDSSNIVIGLFDRDDAGIKEWRLDGTFVADDFFSNVKTSKNGKSFALLLPVPDFRSDCAKNQNLPIEFLFPDDYLAKEVDGKSLELKPIMATRKLGEENFRVKIGDGTAFQQIQDSSKVGFAQFVVPKLPKEAFVAFEFLFKNIEDIIAR